MAYTLKASGLATELVMCVAVDDDDAITEFVSGAKAGGTGSIRITLDGVVAASVATGSWQGTARKYWATTANGSADFNGLRFTASYRPTLAMNNAAGWTYFEAFHALGTRSNLGGFLAYSRTVDSGADGAFGDSGGRLSISMYGGARGAGTTTLPTGTTKFSAAASYDSDDGTTSSRFWYGLNGNTGAGGAQADGTANQSGWGGTDGEVYGIGGLIAQGNHPASRYVTLLFNRVLTTAEVQSLHDDWFGVLLDVGGGGSSSGAAAHYYRQMQ